MKKIWNITGKRAKTALALIAFGISSFIGVYTLVHKPDSPGIIVAGALTAGTTFECNTNPGGIKRVWIQAPLDFEFTQEITWDYSAISSTASNVFIEFAFQGGDAEFSDKFNNSDGSQSWTNTITIIANRRTQALRNVIADLAACSACEGLIIFHEEMNGNVWVGGEKVNQRYKLADGTAAATGRKLTDKNQETIVLVAETIEKINTFSAGAGSIPV